MNIIAKSLIISLFMLLASTSVADEFVIFDGKKEIKLNENYKITTCKNIALANCSNCIDTPNYYFKIKTKQLISRCSGACWHPRGKQREICKTLCPPPQWDCKNAS